MEKSKKLPKRKMTSVLSKSKDWDDRPSMSFTEKEVPAAKGLALKEKIIVEMELELVATRIEDFGSNKGQSTYNFKVCGIKGDKATVAEEKSEQPK